MNYAHVRGDVVATSGRAFERPAMIPSAPHASDEELSTNVRAARRFVEAVLGRGDMNAFDELVADEVWVSTGLKPGAPITSKTEYASVLGSTLGAALANGEMQIQEVLAAVDGAVAVRFTAHADHAGELGGVTATGLRLTLSEIHLMRFRDGKLVENYVGALNPLHWEMMFAPIITAEILG